MTERNEKMQGLYADHRWPQVKMGLVRWDCIEKNNKEQTRYRSPLHSKLLYFFGWLRQKTKVSRVTYTSVSEKIPKYSDLITAPQVLGSIIYFPKKKTPRMTQDKISSLPFEKWWKEHLIFRIKKKVRPRSVMRPTSIIWRSRCVPVGSRVPMSPKNKPRMSFRTD